MHPIRLAPFVLALVVSSTAAAQPPGMDPAAAAPTPAPLSRSGFFHTGVSVDLLDVGSLQAITSHGRVIGVDLGVAFQYDVGTRWALRLPIELGAGGFGNGAGYGELAIIPGAVYRFRSDDEQRWVPYLGGGLRFGYVGIGKRLVGEPLILACCHDWDWGDGGGTGHGDPNTEDTNTNAGGPSLELWGGFEWNRTRWFSLHVAGAVGYERLFATTVIVLRETLGVRVSF